MKRDPKIQSEIREEREKEKERVRVKEKVAF